MLEWAQVKCVITRGFDMADVKAGDMVQLTSGGPVMTVEAVKNEGVACVWFPTKQSPEPSRTLLPAAALKHYTPKKTGAPSSGLM